jgi:hypothetical protein
VRTMSSLQLLVLVAVPSQALSSVSHIADVCCFAQTDAFVLAKPGFA